MSTEKISVVIVDDEPLARAGLRRLVQQEKDIVILEECKNGLEAIEAIRTKSPDLVFIDIKMPGKDGIQVLRSIPPEQLPICIFVTAYDQYAIQAFDLYATDYLLKPYTDERFRQALERAKERLILRKRATIQTDLEKIIDYTRSTHKLLERLAGAGEPEKAGNGYLEQIAIKQAGKIRFVRIEDVDWIEAVGDYVKLHAAGKHELIRGKISEFEKKLDPKKFMRVHRSTIVRVERIKELEPLFHGNFRIVMQDNTQLTLSRNFRDKLELLMKR